MNVVDQLKVVERELALRQRVYPKWVGRGDMKQEEADHQIAGMKAVLETLRACQYYDAIKPGSVRIEIRGVTKAGTRHGTVRLEPDVNNDTLLVSAARGVALDFWKFFSRA